MQDDKINNDDFDDLDFDDLDDENLDDDMGNEESLDDDLVPDDLGDDFPEDDDFSDDDWGDEDNDSDVEDAKPQGNGRSKRSSKIILPLAIGVVIVGAGGFYAMNTLGTGANTSQPIPTESSDIASSDTGLDITEDSLPMPSPMASPIEEEPSLDYEENVSEEEDIIFDTADEQSPAPDERAGTFADNEVLTPMPGLQETEQGTAVPLESLGLDEESDISVDETDESVADINFTDDAESTVEPSEEIRADDTALSTPPELASDAPDTLSIDTGSDVISSAEQSAEVAFDNTSTANTAVNIDTAQYEERINMLESNLTDKDQAISELSAELAALKEQLSSKEAALKEARNALEDQRNAVQEARQSATEATTPKVAPDSVKPSPKPQPTAQTEIMPKWELRAAQPGRAYIGIIGSNDTQVIETGDTLQGIGRIKSIALEDGIWVVKGANGTIKQ